MAVLPTGLCDEISGPVFDFLIELGKIVADDAQADHHKTAGKQLDQDDRRKAAQRLPQQLLHQGDASQHQRGQQHECAQDGHELKGSCGKRRKVANGVPDQRSCRPLRRTRFPFPDGKGDVRGPEADPGGERPEKRVPFP